MTTYERLLTGLKNEIARYTNPETSYERMLTLEELIQSAKATHLITNNEYIILIAQYTKTMETMGLI